MHKKNSLFSHDHIVLTSHPLKSFKNCPQIHWGSSSAHKRGPIIGTLTHLEQKNVIGTHSGSYTIYRALSEATGAIKKDHRPLLTNTDPVVQIGPFPSWKNPKKIISLDPWGAQITQHFQTYLQKGSDIRPTIAITQAHLNIPELVPKIHSGEIACDQQIVQGPGHILVTKIAIEPVWHLPGMAERFKIPLKELRKSLFQGTGGMFPELITRPDLEILLPPIGGTTVYLFGDAKKLGKAKTPVTVRIHDECNGSDVFGSDICTCRPYLVHGVEMAIQAAQAGGVGLICYFRKEGRALGEVTKFLVYNARKRNAAGDSPKNYFKTTECVAGVEDMRFQALMPDVLHWLGVSTIHQLVSMSNDKYDAIIQSGIKVKKRISIPNDLIPEDAWVEIAAKKKKGYFQDPNEKKSKTKIKGRSLYET